MKKAIFIISILALWITACGPSDADLAAVYYAPLSSDVYVIKRSRCSLSRAAPAYTG